MSKDKNTAVVIRAKQNPDGSWNEGVVGTATNMSQANNLVAKVASELIIDNKYQHDHNNGRSIEGMTETGEKQHIFSVTKEEIDPSALPQ